MSLPKKSLLNKVQKNIFLKKKNNKFKSIPYSFSKNTIGETRYSPPSSKEWRNNVYFFNANNMKNLPVYDFNVYFFFGLGLDTDTFKSVNFLNLIFSSREKGNKKVSDLFFRYSVG